ncbi:MAG: N-formylglutamate amidohydrolase [Deltaproteobacteria bacterium]|nr:N-formylglutamate amidohydrolase [Deltaproteobacteria bacterium]
MGAYRIVLSCEHASNAIPERFRKVVRIEESIRKSHRGWDIGALEVAKRLAPALNAKLVAATFTRLLVDANRNAHHPHLFSRFSRTLSEADKASLLTNHHSAYRAEVERVLREAMASGPVLHLSIHSFTPRLDGIERNADIGLLFDPTRAGESRFCRELQRKLREQSAPLRIRRNYPYRGTSDGLTTAFRRKFPGNVYLGIEIELNQAWLTGKTEVRRMVAHLVRTLT